MVAEKNIRRPRRRRIFIPIIIILFAIAIIAAFRNLQPIALNLAEARARVLATEALNNAIASIMDQNIEYGELMRVMYDAEGRVSMLQANTMRMNELASQTVLSAQRNLEELSAQTISVPLGAASGIALFSGSGPGIKVLILPVGSVTTEFVTEFEAAGINQTRHKIFIRATSNVELVAPGGAQTVVISAQLPVAESIIIGQVPESYVNVESVDDMLNLVPD